MQDLLNAYEDHLIQTKHASGNTVSSYLRDLRQFSNWLEQQGKGGLLEADEYMIREYLDSLLASGRSGSTVSRSVASLKNFYSYMVSDQYLETSPVSSEIHIARGEKHFPQILSGDEVELLLSQPSALDPKGARDKAMLEVMYATGMRVSELIGLDLDDVRKDIGMIQCSGKKGARMIPLYPEALKWLLVYMNEMRSSLVISDSEPALFVNVSGNRMSRQGFWKVLKSYQVKAGIEKEITPHTLRHSFAVHLLQNGADLASLQELMGHSDISSTQLYTQMIDRSVRTSYQKYHPKA